MSVWYEASLAHGAKPGPVYSAVGCLAERVHHFWDEPWHPGRYVVRVQAADPSVRWTLFDAPGVGAVREWDATPDEELYGEEWGDVSRFFDAGSRLAESNLTDWYARKLVHCLLNQRGMSEWQEGLWALRFAWGRFTVKFRVWWRER